MKTLMVAALVVFGFVGAGSAAAQDTKVGPKRIVYVAPVYPEAAKAARVTGIVIAELTIDEGGNVAAANILRSVAGLDQAALDAVKQWKYLPTTLNGQPVKTVATVTVNFTLDPAPASTTPVAAATWPPDMGGQQPVRVGGNVAPPERIKYVAPKYPQEAQDAGVTGIVILEIAVDTQGKVAGAHIVRSIPLLDQAAADAVMQWEYTPVLLNGAPVPVIMTVTVNFTMK
jgi:TonB family protein